MKKLYIVLILWSLSWNIIAQTPEKMTYQAVVRNSSSELLTNTQIGMQISIIEGTVNGAIAYIETQTPTTNANGLLSIEIGGDNAVVLTGTFSSIDWASGTYFLKTEIDSDGGSNYTITGISQMLSVPYALHAKSADMITGTYMESDPIFETSVANTITNPDITNWNNKLDVEIDGSVTNEIQDLELNGTMLKISNNDQATEIELSVLSDSVQSNVNIIAGDGITVSGTYPDIVISQSERHYVGELIGTDGEDGVVFWVDHSGEHGLICSSADVNSGTTTDWSDEKVAVVPGGATSAFNGYENTIAINDQSSNSAAGICLSYSTPGTTVGDWYLPAINELKKISQVKYEINKALNTDNFGVAIYWSSTELSFNYAWYSDLDLGISNNNNKNKSYMVRAVRVF